MELRESSQSALKPQRRNVTAVVTIQLATTATFHVIPATVYAEMSVNAKPKYPTPQIANDNRSRFLNRASDLEISRTMPVTAKTASIHMVISTLYPNPTANRTDHGWPIFG